MENGGTDAEGADFKPRTGKVVAQFDNYKTEDGRNLNGTHTLGENIADLGGLATAYDAMKKATEGEPDPMTDGLTRDQRFFLNWATVWRRNFTPDELKVRLTTDPHAPANFRAIRSEEHTSELQSLMRISYAVFCLKKKKNKP